MGTRFLRSLLGVVDEGSIAAAARAENLTPGAVSQRVRALEDEIGSELFARGAHSIVPTAACLKIVPQMRDIVRLTGEIKATVQDTRLVGDFRLGVISVALTDTVPQMLMLLREAAPGINLVIVPGSSSSLYGQIERDEIDAAICVEQPFPLPKTLFAKVLARQGLCILSRTPFGVSQLRAGSEPLIVYDRKSWGGQIAWRFLQSQSSARRIVCEIDSLETIAVLVEAGLGIAVVPHWSSLAPRHPSLSICDVAEPGYERSIIYLSKAFSHRERLHAVLLDAARKSS